LLFQPFVFSAYKSPSDWKLAQMGKEQLYREVVASYQEKRPKVYGLEVFDRSACLRVSLDPGSIGGFCSAMKEFSRLGADLTFLSMSPGRIGDRLSIFICIPSSATACCREAICKTAPGAVVNIQSQASLFSMNGPHFGDRFGIASKLILSLQAHGVELIALNCTVASILGVVPPLQIDPAVDAVKECFDVPAVITRTL
jgi:hypothetical protein